MLACSIIYITNSCKEKLTQSKTQGDTNSCQGDEEGKWKKKNLLRDRAIKNRNPWLSRAFPLIKKTNEVDCGGEQWVLCWWMWCVNNA